MVYRLNVVGSAAIPTDSRSRRCDIRAQGRIRPCNRAERLESRIRVIRDASRRKIGELAIRPFSWYRLSETNSGMRRALLAPNKQLQRTVRDKVPRRVGQRAAAELRR